MYVTLRINNQFTQTLLVLPKNKDTKIRMKRALLNITSILQVLLLIGLYMSGDNLSVNEATAATTLDLNLTDNHLKRYRYTPSIWPEPQYVRVGAHTRVYYAYLPKNHKTRLPVIVALHGAGRGGISMVDTWRKTADANGFAVIGLDSNTKKRWRVNMDQHAFIEAALYDFLKTHGLQAEDVYLFGHSSGARQAIVQAVRRPAYFKRVAAHAGTLQINNASPALLRNVHTEVGLFLGDNDAIFSMPTGQATVDWLSSMGMPARLYILQNHGHWYYSDATKINNRIWQYLESGE